MLAIGTLATRTGVKVPTIRYYEQIGLMPQPDRNGGNQRRYAQAHVDRLGFIRHARDLGFSLDAIRALLSLHAHPDHRCAPANALAADQLHQVRDRIARLQRLETELSRIVGLCEGGAAETCQVLTALGDHNLCGAAH